MRRSSCQADPPRLLRCDSQPRFGPAVDEVITGRCCDFEIHGSRIPVVARQPGHVRRELKDGTVGIRRSSEMEFTCPTPDRGRPGKGRGR